MIYGTGVDIVEIERFETFLNRHKLLNRVYGELELNELRQRNATTQSYAATFCTKEAFSKSLGTGLRGFALSEVQVLHDNLGKPYLTLSGRAKEIADRLNLNFHVSISHSEHYSIATVVAEVCD